MDTNVLNNSTTQQQTSTLLSCFEPTDVKEIDEIIKEVGIKCSPSDFLPQELFSDNINVMKDLIVLLVNKSLSTGSNEGVKSADLVPLLKESSLDKNKFNNFRPVSNLIFLGKLIERVVQRRLDEHMKANNLHIPNQSAYKKNNSTETLSIRLTNDILIACDQQKATVLMLLDLSAAFDTVDHTLLLKILEEEIGIT